MPAMPVGPFSGPDGNVVTNGLSRRATNVPLSLLGDDEPESREGPDRVPVSLTELRHPNNWNGIDQWFMSYRTRACER
jgi:hypothetical protein